MSVVAELTYSNGWKRTISLEIVRDLLTDSAGRGYGGVAYYGETDLDAECVTYGVNEGRATRCDCRPSWAINRDDPNETELVAWRIIAGVDLLIERGIVDPPAAPPCSGDTPL